MGRQRQRMNAIKWDKSTVARPNHNIISSDFPKYVPYPWKCMEGKPDMKHVMAHEYQRMWWEEHKGWEKRMFPENSIISIDVVKRYVLNFKHNFPRPKPEKKDPFKKPKESDTHKSNVQEKKSPKSSHDKKET